MKYLMNSMKAIVRCMHHWGEKKAHSFHSFNKYLLSSYYMPDTF